MKWSLVLHLYQPPNQRDETIHRISSEAYDPLLDFLQTLDVPLTVNVTGILLDQLGWINRHSTLEKFARLRRKRNITFTTTAYTHALLPLWPAEIVKDQLSANAAAHERHLKPFSLQLGAWLPECAYHPRLESILYREGVRWAVMDESSLTGKRYYSTVRRPGGKLHFLVRHRALSTALATSKEQFGAILTALTEPGVAALDGEVFGHFDPQALDRLRDIIATYGDRLVSPKELLKNRPPRLILRPSTWETSAWDRVRQLPYPLWHDRWNPAHRVMWELYQQIWKHISATGGFTHEEWVHRHFTNAISSCWFWWANPQRTAGPFKMKIWNPDMVVEGLTEAIKAARSDPKLSPRHKWQLETWYAEALKRIWRLHWKKER